MPRVPNNISNHSSINPSGQQSRHAKPKYNVFEFRNNFKTTEHPIKNHGEIVNRHVNNFSNFEVSYWLPFYARKMAHGKNNLKNNLKQIRWNLSPYWRWVK